MALRWSLVDGSWLYVGPLCVFFFVRTVLMDTLWIGATFFVPISLGTISLGTISLGTIFVVTIFVVTILICDSDFVDLDRYDRLRALLLWTALLALGPRLWFSRLGSIRSASCSSSLDGSSGSWSATLV